LRSNVMMEGLQLSRSGPNCRTIRARLRNWNRKWIFPNTAPSWTSA
jgi:hypothetical protein